MSNRQSTSRIDARFRMLRLLEQQPDITQREIAENLDISLGGVNYSLRALIDRGLVKIQNFQSSKNKLGYVYFLTPKGIKEKSILTAVFLKAKLREYENLEKEIALLKVEVLNTDKIDKSDHSNK